MWLNCNCFWIQSVKILSKNEIWPNISFYPWWLKTLSVIVQSLLLGTRNRNKLLIHTISVSVPCRAAPLCSVCQLPVRALLWFSPSLLAPLSYAKSVAICKTAFTTESLHNLSSIAWKYWQILQTDTIVIRVLSFQTTWAN